MAKFMQICASRNDLFALDEDGNVYQYDFNAKTWVKLVASRSEAARARTAPRPRAAAPGDPAALGAR
jgi:hypothetical protein